MNEDVPSAQANLPTISSAEGYIDLHLHTTHSDGLYSPEQLVQSAVNKHLRAIAITDHDTVEGIPETAFFAQKYHIEFVPGVEISAYTPEDGEIHLLGYFLDHTNSALLQTLHQQKMRRVDRIVRMVERLRLLGFDIHLDMVRAFAGKKGTIGRPHLARAMVYCGIASSIDDAFKEFLSRGKPAFVPKANITYREAIQAILEADGIPILAHPGLSKKDRIIPTLIELGLRGLEVFHSDHTPDDVQRYMQMVEELDLLATGGSDCHGSGKTPRPLIGTVPVPYYLLDRLKMAKASGRF